WESGKTGPFREAMYYRVAVIDIHLPPLRERREDIPLLVEHFVQTSPYGGRRRLQITREAMEHLMSYPWPGNIRELRNIIERLSVLSDNQVLTVESPLPAILARGARELPPSLPEGDVTLDDLERFHILRTLERHRWNKKRVAGILGIDTKTLYNKLRRYGVPLNGSKEPEHLAPQR